MLSRIVSRLKVRTVLGYLVLLPMLVVVLVCVQQIRAATQISNQLEELGQATSSMIDYVELNAALNRETAGVEARNRAAEFEVDPSVLIEIAGLDDSAANEGNTNAFLVKVNDEEIATALRQARAEIANGAGVEVMRPVHNGLVDPRISGLQRDSRRLSSDLGDGEELVDALSRLSAANAMRATYTDMANTYFLNVPVVDSDLAQTRPELAVLLNEYFDHRNRLAGSGDASTESTLEVIDNDPGVLWLLEATQAVVAADGSDRDFVVDLSDPSAAIELAKQYSGAVRGADLHLEATRAASADLEDLVAESRASESFRLRAIVGLSVLVLVVMLLSIAAVTQVIVTPIRALGRIADALRLGTEIEPVRPSGPVEIRQATVALNEASSNLARAERQALALADGRLNDDSFDDAAQGTLGQSLDTAVSHLRATLTEREEYRRRLALEASHDGLTALPNRKTAIRQLNEAIGRSQRFGTFIGVFFIDIDSFKKTNDTYGHVAGDELLRHIADTLLSGSRETDIVGRLGGDEFLIVAEPIGGPDGAFRRAERLRTAVNRPVMIGGIQFVPSISIGVAVAMGKESEDADTVIRNADDALYQAKEAGRNQTMLFDEDMRVRAKKDKRLEAAIRGALDRDEFFLEVQPIVDVFDQTKKYEALVRWERHGKPVPPNEFIPFAERTDLILDIDRWVVHAAIEALADPAALAELHELSVNVSGRHLLRGDLVTEVRDLLDFYNVDPSALTIEITETALLTDLALVGLQLQGLRSLGVRVAIDDFGTGYTSLGHLRDMPADTLKIDRSFIVDMHDERNLSLVRLIIETGHVLGMDIVVEGIETEEQVSKLRALGADYLQGFYFARPSLVRDLVPEATEEEPSTEDGPSSEDEESVAVAS